MKFADFIVPGAIRAELSAEDKEGVIREMVQSLLDAGGIEAKQFESIVKAILKREELGSTGIRARRGRAAHQAPQRGQAGGHGRRQRRRGRFRQPGRR